MVRKLLLFLVLATPAMAQTVQRNALSTYDLDSTTVIYATMGSSSPGSGNVETVASSTTVTAVSGTPFTPVDIGDEITFSTAGGSLIRRVTAKASGASITVDSAVNLDVTNGVQWTYRPLNTGTTAGDGWYSCADLGTQYHSVQIRQLNVTGGIDVRWEGRALGATNAQPTIIHPSSSTASCGTGTYAAGYCNFTAVGNYEMLMDGGYAQCRIGMKIGTNDDGVDTGAATEQIDIIVHGIPLPKD